MGLLDRFEARLGQAVEGAAAKMFKGAVEPAELAAALQREAMSRRAVLGINRVVAPNTYVVELAEEDYERLVAYADTLTAELAGSIAEYLASEGWATYGDVTVEIREADLATGMFQVSSQAVPTRSGIAPRVPTPPPAVAGPGRPPARVRPRLVVEVTGQQVALAVGSVVLGRGSTADVDLVDGSISRRHAEIRFDGEETTITDLGSTNGTLRNGVALGRGEQTLLSDGDILRLGHVTIVFRQEA